ncbi:MAG: hypothetical protein ACHRXM_05830, partial [Isosphaerales bacterium]
PTTARKEGDIMPDDDSECWEREPRLLEVVTGCCGIGRVGRAATRRGEAHRSRRGTPVGLSP